ncbi:MAG: hypothetical protein A2504_04810 [Bdellovibrionales bacterium RIFOXYD12_FULL_39_22]|nr:MAG: hypothetical protein A2385_07015 [Bdellovibrionales bacterium RIFOXYB1_FULL_39_21]OFZ42013.1 MAG: hypothetical protein A2485_08985 [Bdellovibrionales bacterium RIFOXYC12_FULL_39_17]OFZ50729.1 MAG: hypothetical protein A2404_05935 [Bdellovibrionales bacterium RIFOXYC1_FULL_39_130]OFZ69497.1 MAG: hypothetical protein A2451_02450 [Bdellovibrionales bacterium RIFOXYC2_FULL_39_8]OFZ77952.1 MAG: hypothetical protein A2560_01105 [Bdellovibrionales bacterium RIFOXYD1_FULL_39_84]OFZ93612.1 MAG:
MNWDEYYEGQNRLNIRQVSKRSDIKFAIILVTLLVMLLAPLKLLAFELRLEMLSPYFHGSVGRAPANFTPDDDVEVFPFEQVLWVDTVLQEDSSNILAQTRGQLAKWRQTEEYAKDWNLESLQRYKVPNNKHQRSYVEKNTIKYFDRLLAGEIKRAEKGSTLAQIGRAEVALRPDAKVEFSKSVKIRAKGRLLQGIGWIDLENPFVDYRFVLTAKGRKDMYLSKGIKSAGVYSGIHYNLKAASWRADFDKKLSERITARVSSVQDDNTMMFSDESNKIFQLIYAHSF